MVVLFFFFLKTWELGFLFLSGNFFSGQEMLLI